LRLIHEPDEKVRILGAVDLCESPVWGWVLMPSPSWQTEPYACLADSMPLSPERLGTSASADASGLLISCCQVAEGVFDGAVEGGVGVDHGLQVCDRDLRVDRDGEGAEHLAAGRPGAGRAGQHAAGRVFDELDEPVVAGLVDPAALARLACELARAAAEREQEARKQQGRADPPGW